MPLPPLGPTGDLPAGVHRASLDEVLSIFGQTTPQRQRVGSRLERVYGLALSTGGVSRAFVFGSFVSSKPDPNDIDLFFVMHDSFDVGKLPQGQGLLFDNAAAQAHFGASVFWVRREGAFPSVEDMIAGWGIKRDGTLRGIVELIEVTT